MGWSRYIVLGLLATVLWFTLQGIHRDDTLGHPPTTGPPDLKIPSAQQPAEATKEAVEVDPYANVTVSWFLPFDRYKSKFSRSLSDFKYNFDPFTPRTAVQAALSATFLGFKDFMPHTHIPRIIHHTWKNSDAMHRILTNQERDSSKIDKKLDPPHVEKILRTWRAMNPDAAHILWTDEDTDEFVQTFYPGLWDYYKTFPKKVMKADVFRYLVLHTFGGVYADVDVLCRRPIDEWIFDADLKPWTYDQTVEFPGYQKPIAFIAGVETDVAFSYGDKWKHYYKAPLQICQWTMASAPNHQIIGQAIHKIFTKVRGMDKKQLDGAEVTMLTGPGPWTEAVYDFWRLHDIDGMKLRQFGDVGKIIDDALILPITAFSPGLGQILITVFGTMGAKPIESTDARVQHQWRGVWREDD